jgi:hypothetical protein
MQRDPSAVSLEKFVLNSLSTIAQETTGRGQAQKDVREAAIKLLGERPAGVFSRLLLQPLLAAAWRRATNRSRHLQARCRGAGRRRVWQAGQPAERAIPARCDLTGAPAAERCLRCFRLELSLCGCVL